MEIIFSEIAKIWTAKPDAWAKDPNEEGILGRNMQKILKELNPKLSKIQKYLLFMA